MSHMKANNKYMKNAWKILGVNNSCGWVMPQKLPVN